MAPASSELIRQAVRFCIVGVGNTMLTYVLTFALTAGVGIALALASAIGYAAGVAQSFVLNRFWTFGLAPDSRHAVAGQLLGFIVVNLTCGATFTFGMTLAAPRFGLVIATIVGVAVVTPINFILTRRYVFP